jgi:hypothetical protein
MRAMRKTCLAALLLLIGCGGGDAFFVRVIFPLDAKDLAASLRVVAVKPAEGVDCTELVDGSGSVGSNDFPIHDEVSFDIPIVGEGPRPLDVLETGRFLFYAEAVNGDGQVFVRGCTAAEAGGSGVHEVTINLDWITERCEDHADCDDENECTSDSCVDYQCVYENEDITTDCNDGLYCTTSDKCDGSGSCTGDVRDCSDANDQCNLGVCQESPPSCVPQPDNEGQDCVDGVFCTTGETCQSGICTGGTITDCSDGVDCTIDTCDSQNDQCQNQADDSYCDDGVACTSETCDLINDCVYVPNAGGCPEYHIGPIADSCPHNDPSGTPTTVCDFEGYSGLEDAVVAAPAEGARFYLYDELGSGTGFGACSVNIPANSYLGVAPGIDPGNVIVACTSGSSSNGVIELFGDNIHVERLTIVNLAGTHYAITAWPAGDEPENATGGHLIENVLGMALHAEYLGGNSLVEPLGLGSDTTVRNCHFYGHYENQWEMTYVNNTRFLNNTFVYFQQAGTPSVRPEPDPPEDSIQGTDGIVFANNVFLSLTRQEDNMLLGDDTTTNLSVTGNLIEGYTEAVIDLDPADLTNNVQGNILGQAELESPYVPKFLADSSQQPTGLVPGEGVSLDGVSIEGRSDILPGAYQLRSSMNGPRRMTIRVGNANCGANGCDIDVSEDNEIQRAVWNSWPGGTIELYPYDSYAGNAVIPWGLTLTGMGDQPEDVVLISAEEDPLWTTIEMWERHNSILTALHRMDIPVLIENLHLIVDSDTQSDDRAILIEGSQENGSSPADWHILRRLRIEALALGTPGLFQALFLGDKVRVQDVLINGDFASCIRFGVRYTEARETPPTSDQIINLTCRLTGTGDYLPEAAFDVASIVDTLFINMTLEQDASASVFRAQRRSTGDTAAIALDVPDSYDLYALTLRGYTTYSEGFDDIHGTYTESGKVVLDVGDPFFESETDSHLATDCTAIDSGIDPATIDASLSAGVSLDGVDRQTVQDIDRGAYEQGQ